MSPSSVRMRVTASALAAALLAAALVLVGPASARASTLADCTPISGGHDCRNLDFSGQDLTLDGSTYLFGGANFTGATLHGQSDMYSSYSYANFTDATFSGFSAVGSTNFLGADFTRADLGTSFFQQAQFGNANFTNARLKNADLAGTWIAGAVFTGSDLVPSAITVLSPDGSAQAVSYSIPQNASLTSVGSPAPPSTSCAPASGSAFPVGTTTVTCTISSTTYVQGYGWFASSSTASFAVTVYRGAEVTRSTLSTVFVVGQPGSASFAAVGDGALVFSPVGAMPNGLTLASDGTVSGTASGPVGAWIVTVSLVQTLPGGGGVTTSFSTIVQVLPAPEIEVAGAPLRDAELVAGAPHEITVGGVAPGATVHALVSPPGTDLGTVTAGADGIARFAVDLPAGGYEIAFEVTWTGGMPPYTVRVPFSIVAPAAAPVTALAATGAPGRTGATALLALLLLLLGAVAAARGARRA